MPLQHPADKPKFDGLCKRLARFRPIKYLLVFVGVYALIGFLLIPLAIKVAAPWLASQYLNQRQLSMDWPYVNPFTMRIALKQLALADLTEKPLALLDNLTVDVAWTKLLQGRLTIQEVSVSGVQLHLAYIDEQRLNIEDLLQLYRPTAADDKADTRSENTAHNAQANEAMPVDVTYVQLENIQLLLQSQPEYDSDSAQQTMPQAEPILQLGQLRLEQLNYLADQPSLTIQLISMINSEFAAQRNANGQMRFIKLLADAGLMQADASGAATEQVSATPAPVSQAEAENKAEDNGSANETNTAMLQIAELSLQGNALRFTDLALSKRVSFALENIAVSLQSISLQPEREIPFKFSLQLQREALSNQLAVDGVLQFNPVLDIRAQLQSKLLQLDLLEPYLLEHFPISRVTGNIAFDSELAVSLDQRQALEQLSLSAQFQLADFALDDAKQKTVIGLQRLALDAIDIQRNPETNTFSVNSLVIEQPKLKLLLDAQGQSNIEQLFIARTSDIEQAEKSAKQQHPSNTEHENAAAAAPLLINLSELTVREGELSLIDRQVTPHLSLQVKPWQLTMRNLASTLEQAAELDFSAAINQSAKVKLSGEVLPLTDAASAKLSFALTNLSLPGFSGYASEYIGREISRGKLNFTADYAVENHLLQAKNHIELIKVRLGRRVDSEQATNMPVGLGLALLKNPKGEVIIDMPVKGRLDDPNFNYFGTLWKTSLNLVLKAAASPFKLLSGIVNPNELSIVSYYPGQAKLSAKSAEQLKQLTQLMRDQTALTVDIEGCYDAKEDAKYMSIGGDNRLHKLAKARAQLIYQALIKGGISAERLFVNAVNTSAELQAVANEEKFSQYIGCTLIIE